MIKSLLGESERYRVMCVRYYSMELRVCVRDTDSCCVCESWSHVCVRYGVVCVCLCVCVCVCVCVCGCLFCSHTPILPQSILLHTLHLCVCVCVCVCVCGGVGVWTSVCS